jgi:hypothetical protein
MVTESKRSKPLIQRGNDPAAQMDRASDFQSRGRRSVRRAIALSHDYFPVHPARGRHCAISTGNSPRIFCAR